MDGRGPYGLACQNCAKGKVKCIAMADGDGCQRCHRLKKPCHPSHGVRKRESQNFSQNPLIEEMDAKLDNVLSLLQSVYTSAPPQIAAPQPFAQTTAPKLPSPQPIPNSSPQLPQAPRVPQAQQLQQQSSVPTYPLPIPWARDGEKALTLFRRRFLRFFPFVYLRPGLSAQQLQQERPFFWETILAVTSRSVQERLVRAKEIKSVLATAMVVENRSNLDLLLGVLTYAAWAQDQFIVRIPTAARFMELAVSIVNDLHWTKPTPRDEHMIVTLGGNRFFLNEVHQPCCVDAQRAVLGCYLMSSFVSIYFSRSDTMPWTAQMEKYLQTLENKGEWRGDAALATHVRLQRVVENARQARDQHKTQPVIPFFLGSFMSQLQGVRESIPPQLVNDDLILAHVHYVNLSIHETAYTANYNDPSPDTPDESDGAIGPDAIDCMRHSLQALQSWITVFFRLEPEDLVGFTIAMWDQVGRSFVTLYRLSKHPAPGWDRNAVFKTIDIVDVVDHLAKMVQKISPSADEPFPDDMWSRIGLLTRAIRAWLCTELKSTEEARSGGWEQHDGYAAAGSAAPVQTGLSSTHVYTGMPEDVILQSMPQNFAHGNPAWLENLGLMTGNAMGNAMGGMQY
ncbi:hypothetical protein BDW66DRAFT_73921 [Aspergillus desertorum]